MSLEVLILPKRRKKWWKVPNYLARTELSVWIWRTNFSGRDEDGEQTQALTSRNNLTETRHSI